MPEPREAQALLKAVATVIKEQISNAVTAFIERLDAVERRLLELPVPKDGKDGVDGKSVTSEELEPIVEKYVGGYMLEFPRAKDGKDGKDGLSVTIDDVLPIVREAVQQIPKPKDGVDGKNVTANEVMPTIRQWFDAIPKPVNGTNGVDGKSVTLDDVRELHESLFAKWQLDWERRAMDVNQRCLDRFEKPANGKDGVDGLGFDDMTATFDGKRTVTLRFERGDQVKEFPIKFNTVLEEGVWLHDKQYEQGDAVTCGGNYWIALKDTKARPGENNNDWRLSVRRGRDGKDAVTPARSTAGASR
jgi:hypothetical protein